MKKRFLRTRVIFDAKGLGTREREIAPGKWEADLFKPDSPPPSLAPYGSASITGKSVRQRSRLDFMRALSEEIKRNRKPNSE